MKIDMKRKMTTLVPILGLLGSAGSLADEQLPSGYVMNFYMDSAQAASVKRGAYERVIEKLEKEDSRAAIRVADQLNLCIAYTKTKQLDKATEACDTALAKAGKRIRRGSLSRSAQEATQAANTERAIALINRGVLYAVAGDSDQAKAMFETAASLDTRNEAADINLQILQKDIAESDS